MMIKNTADLFLVKSIRVRMFRPIHETEGVVGCIRERSIGRK